MRTNATPANTRICDPQIELENIAAAPDLPGAANRAEGQWTLLRDHPTDSVTVQLPARGGSIAMTLTERGFSKGGTPVGSFLTFKRDGRDVPREQALGAMGAVKTGPQTFAAELGAALALRPVSAHASPLGSTDAKDSSLATIQRAIDAGRVKSEQLSPGSSRAWVGFNVPGAFGRQLTTTEAINLIQAGEPVEANIRITSRDTFSKRDLRRRDCPHPDDKEGGKPKTKQLKNSRALFEGPSATTAFIGWWEAVQEFVA